VKGTRSLLRPPGRSGMMTRRPPCDPAKLRRARLFRRHLGAKVRRLHDAWESPSRGLGEIAAGSSQVDYWALGMPGTQFGHAILLHCSLGGLTRVAGRLREIRLWEESWGEQGCRKKEPRRSPPCRSLRLSVVAIGWGKTATAEGEILTYS
jgi:hypothetical protein